MVSCGFHRIVTLKVPSLVATFRRGRNADCLPSESSVIADCSSTGWFAGGLWFNGAEFIVVSIGASSMVASTSGADTRTLSDDADTDVECLLFQAALIAATLFCAMLLSVVSESLCKIPIVDFRSILFFPGEVRGGG